MARPVPDDLSMLASFYRRWEPQEDRRREISEDLKELFSEAKGNGFNGKAMRRAFAAQYRLDHEDSEQREAREQTDEETELYLSALARVRESGDDEPASHVAAAVGGDGAGASVSTDTQSTAALSGSAGQPSRGADAYSPATDARVKASGYQAPPVDTPPKPVNDDFARIQVIGSIR